MCSFITIVTAAMLCIAVDGELIGLADEDVAECLDYVVCESGNVRQVRDAIRLTKPKAMAYAMKLTRENYGWDDAKDDDDTWDALPDKYCPSANKDELRSNFAVDISDYWGKLCDDGDEEECNAMEDAMTALSKLLSENYAKGVCGKPAKALKAARLPGFGR